MSEDERLEFIELVRRRAALNLLFLPHAASQMNRPERMITPQEVRQVALAGELIEEYAEDARGHSCLMLGWGDENRPVHVVCAPKEDYLAIITAYIPDPARWSDGFRTRIKP